jgi:hypothetical protein
LLPFRDEAKESAVAPPKPPLPLILIRRALPPVLQPFQLIQQIRIMHWRRDHISTRSPLPQIQNPAPIRAKRKIRICRQHNLPTRRTKQTFRRCHIYSNILATTS